MVAWFLIDRLVEFGLVGSHLLVTILTLQNRPVSPPSNVGTHRRTRRRVDGHPASVRSMNS
jgi:hypothetical protein